jgi:hypothetical protein
MCNFFVSGCLSVLFFNLEIGLQCHHIFSKIAHTLTYLLNIYPYSKATLWNNSCGGPYCNPNKNMTFFHTRSWFWSILINTGTKKPKTSKNKEAFPFNCSVWDCHVCYPSEITNTLHPTIIICAYSCYCKQYNLVNA